MYADGDGVAADDCKAYQYFLEIVQNYDEDAAPQRDIGDRERLRRARRLQPERHAGDAHGREPGAGAADVPVCGDEFRRLQRAVQSRAHLSRWQPACRRTPGRRRAGCGSRPKRRMRPSQALLGHLLFNGADGVARQRARGLMWLTLAREAALDPAKDAWIVELYDKAMARGERVRPAGGARLARRLAARSGTERIAQAAASSSASAAGRTSRGARRSIPPTCRRRANSNMRAGRSRRSRSTAHSIARRRPRHSANGRTKRPTISSSR